MIWGKFDKDKKQSNRWYSWYAWHPVQLEDGRYCWLQRIERKQVNINNYSGGVNSYYRLLPVKEFGEVIFNKELN